MGFYCRLHVLYLAKQISPKLTSRHELLLWILRSIYIPTNSNPLHVTVIFSFFPSANLPRQDGGKQDVSTQLCRWTTAMRSPALARLQSRAISGLTASSVRVQPQNFLARRCASTAALRGPAPGPASQSLWEKQLKQRRHASSTTAAAV